jgi:hypothetical protein
VVYDGVQVRLETAGRGRMRLRTRQHVEVVLGVSEIGPRLHGLVAVEQPPVGRDEGWHARANADRAGAVGLGRVVFAIPLGQAQAVQPQPQRVHGREPSRGGGAYDVQRGRGEPTARHHVRAQL